MDLFAEIESEVRNYIRHFPTVFSRAEGHLLWDQHGKSYIDFFSGAGALNYGHNVPQLKEKLIDYLESNGVAHSLDMATVAKQEFLDRFREIILQPRNLDYKLQFVGPTGTNAVEAALKLARKVTARSTVVSFENCFHGATLGALALCDTPQRQQSAGVPSAHTVVVPFDDGRDDPKQSLTTLRSLFQNSRDSQEYPAAVILETVQADGGVRLARSEWLQELADIVHAAGALLIVDDIQAGCGRTGTFFSFERTNIKPDIICLSKSISGFGLPMALVLIRPELDQWSPGEHDGTFRGNNLAFVTASESLEFWTSPKLMESVAEKSTWLKNKLQDLRPNTNQLITDIRGCGLIWGVEVSEAEKAKEIRGKAFDNGLLVEIVGREENVVKLLPPLTINNEGLHAGTGILIEAFLSVTHE